MSLSSLYDASKSAVDMSELAVQAAEEALTAAKSANAQAKIALETIKAAIENDIRQKEIKEHVSENQSKIKETPFEEPYKIPDDQVESKNACTLCKKSDCLQGKPLTVNIVKDPTGLRVRAAGDSWAEAYRDLEGIVTGSKQTKVNKFLTVRWDVSSKDDQYTFLSKNEPKFVIAQCKEP